MVDEEELLASLLPTTVSSLMTGYLNHPLPSGYAPFDKCDSDESPAWGERRDFYQRVRGC